MSDEGAGAGDEDGARTVPFSTLEYREHDAVAWLVLDRTETLNALTPAMISDLAGALHLAATQAAVRCVVLTGEGSAFCAGVDLQFVRGLGEDTRRAVGDFLEPFGQMIGQMLACPKPLVVAINGVCVGGGLEMVLACDIAIASEGARIGDGHAKFGLLPASGSVQRLGRAVGTGMATEMVLTGELYSAPRLQAAGLLSQVVPAGELHAEAAQLASVLSRRSPSGLTKLKAMLRNEPSMSEAEAGRYELRLARENFDTGAPQRGITAFMNGSEPVFGPDE